MQIFTSPEQFKEHYSQCAATIGKYDGMHLGHQAILDVVLKESKSLGLPAVVILSEPQPEEFFAGVSSEKKAPPRLNHFLDKVAFLKSYGIDAVYKMQFDYSLSQCSPESFVEDFLMSDLGVKSLVIGDDFRFGNKRAGNFTMLQSMSEQCGFTVQSIAPCLQSEQRISSTRVRDCLESGDCKKVQDLLGRSYSISGNVVQGKQLGRQLGAPTANVFLHSRSIPMRGVFSVTVEHGDNNYSGVANIGYKPTVEEVPLPSLEVYLFNFDEDIYGELIKVSFEEKIRDEKKFSGIEELKQQIFLDVEHAKKFFES